MSILNQFKQWLASSSARKRAERFKSPTTIAYYWDGSVPVPREIRDISFTGAYLQTSERWYPGTIVRLTLKVDRPDTDGQSESIQVRCKVVRQGADGVGLQFLSQEENERKGLQRFLTDATANPSAFSATNPNTNARRDRP